MSKIKTITMVDTHELCKYAEDKYGMDNNKWHSKVWRPFMVDYIMDGPCTFSKVENPDNLLEEQINDFLEDNPELGGKVTFIFTN